MARMKNMVIINTLSILESQRLSYKQDRGFSIIFLRKKCFCVIILIKTLVYNDCHKSFSQKEMIFLL